MLDVPFTLSLTEKKKTDGTKRDGPADRQMVVRTDGWMDGRTDPHIETFELIKEIFFKSGISL